MPSDAEAEPSAESLALSPEIENPRIVRRGQEPGHAFRLSLSEIRRLFAKTQVEMAASAGVTQEEVSRLERRADMRLSSLQRYAAALGLRVEVVFVRDQTGHRIVLAEPAARATDKKTRPAR